MAYLTSRLTATGASLTDIIHIVVTGDTSQNPAGSSYKIEMGKYAPLFPNTYVTGNTFNNSTYDLTIGRNDGTQIVSNLSILASDMTITGGTYNPSNGTATFTNNSGMTFDVTGFITGFTDTYVTGGTYSTGTTTLTDSANNIITITGYTDGVVLTTTNQSIGGVKTLDDTLYFNIASNSYGVNTTLSNSGSTGIQLQSVGIDNDLLVLNNFGGGTGIPLQIQQGGDTTITMSSIGGISANTISATTYYNLPTDIRVTGGTYSAGTAVFSNNTGGTFTVTGFVSGSSISPITIENTSSLFSTGLAGSGSGSTTTNSNFFGVNAGYSATSASYSNFFGWLAGNNATIAAFSNFLGKDAGNGATNASYSNFLGLGAGYLATGASYSNFMGQSAGNKATNANYSNFIGQVAGYYATNAYRSNFFGESAGYQAKSANDSNFMGYWAGHNATNANYSNFIGGNAGDGATDATNSNFFGQNAGLNASGASNSTLIGYQVGGKFGSNTLGSNNIIIGTNVSLPDGTANSINLGGVLFGSGTYAYSGGNPSITGQTTGKIGVNVVVPTNTLHVYSEVADTSGLRLERLTSVSPTSTGQAIGVDASGNVVTIVASSGGTIANGFIRTSDSSALNGTLKQISDNSGNTTTFWLSTTGMTNYGGNGNTTNTAFGLDVLKRNTTGQQNVSIGNSTHSNNTTGSYNTTMGYEAMVDNTTGSGNAVFGINAMYKNTSGSWSTAIGNTALYGNTTGSWNTAIGQSVLSENTIGRFNVGVGNSVLLYNVTGEYNVAIGASAIMRNARKKAANTLYSGISYTIITSGSTDFTLIGAANNIPGTVFTALSAGTGSGTASANANNNIGIGNYVLGDSVAGSNNVAIGYQAGIGILNGANNTIIGSNIGTLPTDLSNNIIIADGSGNQRITVNSSGLVFASGTTNALISGDTTGKSLITKEYLTANMSSGGTDTFITGGTYSADTTTLNNNTGGTVTITGYTYSPFEKVNEGSNPGIIVRGRVASNYGPIGEDAVDLSYSSLASSSAGATGTNSFAQGYDVIASGNAACAFGDITTAGGSLGFVTGRGGYEAGYANFLTGAWNVVTDGAYATVVGQFGNIITNNIGNVNDGGNTMFAVGNGTGDGSSNPLVRSTAFQVFQSGLIIAPTLTNATIDGESTGKVLITRDYLTGATINNAIIEVGSGNTTLNSSQSNRVMLFTVSGATLTIPSGLTAGFAISIVTLANVTITVILSGVTLFNNTGLTLYEKQNFTLKNRATPDNYISTGYL